MTALQADTDKTREENRMLKAAVARLNAYNENLRSTWDRLTLLKEEVIESENPNLQFLDL